MYNDNEDHLFASVSLYINHVHIAMQVKARHQDGAQLWKTSRLSGKGKLLLSVFIFNVVLLKQ